MTQQTQTALKTVAGGKAAVCHDAPVPELRDNYVLAHPKCFSLNPTDWKHMRALTKPGSTLGTDWSGVVIAVGKDVTRFKPGDEVCGVCHGGANHNLNAGAYAQTIAAAEWSTMHKPAHMSFEEAATFGVGQTTCGQSMYFGAGLDMPSIENLGKTPTKDVLIYGASSGTGTLAVQFAKLSGYRVLTTSSPHNFDLLRSLGADEVYDYKDPSAIEAIKASTKDSLTFVLDCIGTESTAEFCAAVLPTTPGLKSHYHSVAYPLKPTLKQLRPEAEVKATDALGYTFFAEPFELMGRPGRFEIDPLEVDFVKNKWIHVVDKLAADGYLKPHPMVVKKGDLETVLEGLYEMQANGSPSGKKMVFTMNW